MGILSAGDFGGRRAPYAPISALERFFERIRDRAVPETVDQRFLQKLNVAVNNEYSLLSALKFLGVVDDRGRPTMAYRQLQTTDRFQDTLGHLVRTSYRPVFALGIDELSNDDLVNFFRVSSSPSQARNAARFFQAVCRLAGIDRSEIADLETGAATEEPSGNEAGFAGEAELSVASDVQAEVAESRPGNEVVDESRLRVKARLLEKLPSPTEAWSAREYKDVCAMFVEMLRSLETD